ncbi:hypothetical protein DQ04_13421000 [Trypanosoma grayi]|uniref:hypothetical protein n=1 Tax=Trypanosoma grayi TaxID=71804 RepID=UPI0004F412DF|nr:hypothetical protein DQ04_13421000 [Trypanosoma grayi]KEG06540.1 hypothetical protein DQ04_13421000 [Trypanosoma grayi]
MRHTHHDEAVRREILERDLLTRGAQCGGEHDCLPRQRAPLQHGDEAVLLVLLNHAVRLVHDDHPRVAEREQALLQQRLELPKCADNDVRALRERIVLVVRPLATHHLHHTYLVQRVVLRCRVAAALVAHLLSILLLHQLLQLAGGGAPHEMQRLTRHLLGELARWHHHEREGPVGDEFVVAQ